MKHAICILLAVCLAARRDARAGTVYADRVEADEVLTRSIGFRLPAGILFYPFSEAWDTVVPDDSGSGNDGAASGCVWTNAGHRASGAVRFSGAGGWINAGQVTNFPALGAYSVSLWFLHDGGGDFGAGYGHKILDKTSYYHDWSIHLWPYAGTGQGRVGLSLYEGGVNRGLSAAASNYMDNAWHHLAIVRDGADGLLWIDGELKDSCSDMISVFSSSDLCVGNSFSGDSFQRKGWSGMLDQIRIFDRAISNDEITAFFEEGLRSPPVSVSAGLAVSGGLSVTGPVSFAEGVLYSRPLGDLSCGSYTNAP